MLRSIIPKHTAAWSTITRAMSSASEEGVKITEVGRAGVLTLNRPKALNALNLDMVRQIYPAMLEWQNTKSLVIIKSDIEKSFCAGGDVRRLVEGPIAEAYAFLREEYTLNHLIGTYRLPYVAFISGITMGGGVGLSVHGRYRVATEKTMFAMPETLIGLFPDVGGSHFLPRLQGQLGMYLGLTGARLKGKDVHLAGIATHYCEYGRLGELEQALVACGNSAEVEATLAKFCPVDASAEFSLAAHREQIDSCFAADSVEGIISNLERDNSAWAQKTLKALAPTSPTSLKVTHRQLREGKDLDLAGCLKMELRLGHRHLEDSDFAEGVRAMLIDKDNAPKWKYSKLSEVPAARVQSYFESFEDSTRELKLLESSKL